MFPGSAQGPVGSQLSTGVDTPASFWCLARLQGWTTQAIWVMGGWVSRWEKAPYAFLAHAMVRTYTHARAHAVPTRADPHTSTYKLSRGLEVLGLVLLTLVVVWSKTISLASALELQLTKPRPGHCQPSAGLRGGFKLKSCVDKGLPWSVSRGARPAGGLWPGGSAMCPWGARVLSILCGVGLGGLLGAHHGELLGAVAVACWAAGGRTALEELQGFSAERKG